MADDDASNEVRLDASRRFIALLEEVASDASAAPADRDLARTLLDRERADARMDIPFALADLADIARNGEDATLRQRAREALQAFSKQLAGAGADVSRWPVVPETKQ
ncbi:hypothetical protein [Falsiroseomonas bella]|nr:hypothetical protein [Falsiroseomonas bella]